MVSQQHRDLAKALVGPPSVGFVVAALGLTALALACEAPGVTTILPDGDDASPNDPAIEVRVAIGVEDVPVLAPLGWNQGVPGAVVRYLRVEAYDFVWDSVITDAEGVARIPNPAEGLYWVAVERTLSADEAATLGSPPRAAEVLGGGEKLRVSRGGSAVLQVPVRLAKPGSFVISEIYFTIPQPWETGDRSIWGGEYIELYNNSRVTEYLDGMVLGAGYNYWHDSSEYGHHSCSASEPMRNDPSALWSNVAWQFPGEGGEYPVGPGETRIIAVQAQDHSVIHADLVDLSGADFELEYPGGADNPAAPDLQHVGPISYGAEVGFGLRLSRTFLFISAPVDVSALPVLQDPGEEVYERPYRAYPADKILDAAVIWWNSANANVTRVPPCQDPVYPGFDHIPGGFWSQFETRVSVSRRRVSSLDGAETLLLDTNTSRVDFVRSVRTPGWVPR